MRQTRVERRLAAILAADVVGYSRLIGQDEVGTLARLKAIRREIIDPQVQAHGGRVINTSGDAILIEFPSAVAAVECAVTVQSTMAERAQSEAPEKRIEFRVGINVGDVVVEEGNLLGDGVNVAARLEGIAEPGGICISARVQEDASGKLDLAVEDLGEQALKNIARPVRVYRVRIGRGPFSSMPRPVLPLPDKPSIAVLPFTNMSGDAEQEYFADGVVEDIITALSRVKWLFVIARNSSFTYKGRTVDLKAGRTRAGRALRSRGQHPQGRQSGPNNGAAHRRGKRRSRLGRALRPRPHGHFCAPGRNHRERGRRHRAKAPDSRDRTSEA